MKTQPRETKTHDLQGIVVSCSMESHSQPK